MFDSHQIQTRASLCYPICPQKQKINLQMQLLAQTARKRVLPQEDDYYNNATMLFSRGTNNDSKPEQDEAAAPPVMANSAFPYMESQTQEALERAAFEMVVSAPRDYPCIDLAPLLAASDAPDEVRRQEVMSVLMSCCTATGSFKVKGTGLVTEKLAKQLARPDDQPFGQAAGTSTTKFLTEQPESQHDQVSAVFAVLLDLLQDALAMAKGITALPSGYLNNANGAASLAISSCGVADFCPHSDATHMSLIHIPSQHCLEEIRGGHWTEVPSCAEPGEFLVVLGDVMHIWSNGLFRANIHRVKQCQDATTMFVLHSKVKSEHVGRGCGIPPICATNETPKFCWIAIDEYEQLAAAETETESATESPPRMKAFSVPTRLHRRSGSGAWDVAIRNFLTGRQRNSRS